MRRFPLRILALAHMFVFSWRERGGRGIGRKGVASLFFERYGVRRFPAAAVDASVDMRRVMSCECFHGL